MGLRLVGVGVVYEIIFFYVIKKEKTLKLFVLFYLREGQAGFSEHFS